MALADELSQFYGTEHYYKHWIGGSYTDGVKFLAEEANAYWLVDTIFGYQSKHKNVEFQVWKLNVNLDQHNAVLTMDDGNGHIFVTQKLAYTDFPLKEIKLYLQNKILFLQSEY